jgi:hypothetical protein
VVLTPPPTASLRSDWVRGDLFPLVLPAFFFEGKGTESSVSEVARGFITDLPALPALIFQGFFERLKIKK